MNETQTTTLNRPVAFPGTPAEAVANYQTHQWYDYEGGTECDGCCAKIWHVAASYPCGTEPPREVVVIKLTKVAS